MTPAAWAEAVFHVLAHLDVGARAASCHDQAYIAWARERLGPAEDRALAEDVRVLGGLLDGDDALARAQLLARLWDDAKEADPRDLAALDVENRGLLAALVRLGPAAEILRAAAELERPLLAKIPWPEDVAWPNLGAAAPALVRCRIEHVRSLPRRGRVHDAHIFVGAPGVAGGDAEHLAWQAAHEATVFELSPRVADFRALELQALALLRARAGAAGLGDRHARWLATVDHAALGPIPDVTDLGD